MQYQGGKSRIASHIAAKIREMYPTATEIWEPFCGGGAVTLALAKAGFKVHASDSHEDLILMWQALMRGETEPFADVTEAEYAALKTAAPSARRGFVGFGASFGGGWWSGYGRKDEAHVRDFVWQSSQIWLKRQNWPLLHPRRLHLDARSHPRLRRSTISGHQALHGCPSLRPRRLLVVGAMSSRPHFRL